MDNCSKCLIDTECTQCYNDLYVSLDSTQCISNCSTESEFALHYETYGIRKCKLCEDNEYFLENNNTKACVINCPIGFFGNYSQKKCLQCHENCLTCNGTDDIDCLSCKEPLVFVQQTSTCLELVYISPILESLDNPTQFVLRFPITNSNSEQVSNYIEYYLWFPYKYSEITIVGLSANKYSYSIIEGDINNQDIQSLEINFEYNVTEISNNQLIWTISIPDFYKYSFPEVIFVNKQFQIQLNEWQQCQANQFYNFTLKQCQNEANLITIVFSKTKYPSKLTLELSNEVTLEFYDTLKEEYIESIYLNEELLDPQNYTITLQEDTSYIYDLALDLKSNIISGSELKLTFKQEKILKEKIKLNQFILTVSMNMYNYLNEEDLDSIKSYTDSIQMQQKALKYLSFLNSVLGSSGLGAKLMFILSIVSFIKYLDINYSSEVLLIFQTDIPPLVSYNLFHTNQLFKSQEESLSLQEIILPSKFSKYDISFLFLRNTINSLIYLVVVILLGIFFNFLNSRIHILNARIKSKIIRNFINYLYKTIAWNMVIWYILSILPEVFLYSLLQLNYFTFEFYPILLKINYTCAIVFILFVLLFIVWCIGINILLVICLDKMMIEGKTTYPIQSTFWLFQKINKYIKKLRKSQQQEWILKYQIFYAGTRDELILQKFALLVDILRQLILLFIIVIIEYDVFIQILWMVLDYSYFINYQTLVQFVYLMYLVAYKPYSSLYQQIQFVLIEFLIFAVYCITVMLARQDKIQSFEDIGARKFFGKMMLYLIFGLLLIAIINSSCQILLVIQRLIITVFRFAEKKLSKKDKKNKLSLNIRYQNKDNKLEVNE